MGSRLDSIVAILGRVFGGVELPGLMQVTPAVPVTSLLSLSVEHDPRLC